MSQFNYMVSQFLGQDSGALGMGSIWDEGFQGFKVKFYKYIDCAMGVGEWMLLSTYQVVVSDMC